jgi:hypothetical protein
MVYIYWFYFVISIISSVHQITTAPALTETTTMRNLNTTFPGIFQSNYIEYIEIHPTNKYTQFITPKISSKCMYASVENFLSESNYIMPQECGLVATMTVHDSAFTKSIVDVGTFACTQYHRDKCNPPMHQYYLNYTEDTFKNDVITFYKYKETVSFRHTLDTTLLKYIVVLKDEYSESLYWTTEYCMKYMTVTSDNKFVHLGPGVHHYDAATKQFCIGDYSNMCTPAGPFKTKLEFAMSLPMQLTISSDRPYHKYFEKQTYDDTIKLTIPYDDNNRIELDKKHQYVYVAGNIRPMQPMYQCVKYHYVPMSTIFHIDIIIDSIEKKVIQYFSQITTFILDNIHLFFDYIASLLLKLYHYFFEKFLTLVTYVVTLNGCIEIIIITIFMLSTDYNYTNIIFINVTFIIIKKWLFMW